MELSVHVDLALGDVASQVRDGVGDVVVGHRQDGHLDDMSDMDDMIRMGTWVMLPFLPCTLPALSYMVARSVYLE